MEQKAKTQSKTRISILWFVLGIVVVGFGCSPKSEPGRYKARTDDITTVGMNSCRGSELSARILNSQQAQFQQLVGNLVSATMSPDSIGQVSGTGSGSTGVEVQLKLAFDNNKNISAQTSGFKLIIRDAMVGQTGTDGQPIEAIEILHTPSSSSLSGQYNSSTGDLFVQFEDDYGTVIIAGKVQGGQLSAQVSFKNYTAWDGSAAREGTLGTIQAQSCSF